jgi:hypothetical protein
MPEEADLKVLVEATWAIDLGRALELTGHSGITIASGTGMKVFSKRSLWNQLQIWRCSGSKRGAASRSCISRPL